jgi:hypothetical protein
MKVQGFFMIQFEFSLAPYDRPIFVLLCQTNFDFTNQKIKKKIILKKNITLF